MEEFITAREAREISRKKRDSDGVDVMVFKNIRNAARKGLTHIEVTDLNSITYALLKKKEYIIDKVAVNRWYVSWGD